MIFFDENDLDYSCIVQVTRPLETYDENGDYVTSSETVVESMIADIQYSLKVRSLVSEDGTGKTDNALWVMFCTPPERLDAGDMVSDGERTFVIDAVGDWGSHTECVMRLV